nr:hypothetical protein CFP56_53059 [Quercus suber]
MEGPTGSVKKSLRYEVGQGTSYNSSKTGWVKAPNTLLRADAEPNGKFVQDGPDFVGHIANQNFVAGTNKIESNTRTSPSVRGKTGIGLDRKEFGRGGDSDILDDGGKCKEGVSSSPCNQAQSNFQADLAIQHSLNRNSCVYQAASSSIHCHSSSVLVHTRPSLSLCHHCCFQSSSKASSLSDSDADEEDSSRSSTKKNSSLFLVCEAVPSPNSHGVKVSLFLEWRMFWRAMCLGRRRQQKLLTSADSNFILSSDTTQAWSWKNADGARGESSTPFQFAAPFQTEMGHQAWRKGSGDTEGGDCSN